MSIYTRKGDGGNTSLFTGEPVTKDDMRVQVYGTFDECQAQLGMARAFVKNDRVAAIIYDLQADISCACAELASNPDGVSRLKRRLGPQDVAGLERLIA